MSLDSLRSRVELLEHDIAIQKKKLAELYFENVTHDLNQKEKYQTGLDKLAQLQTDLITANQLLQNSLR
jgi:hypothetical protein